MDLRISYGLTNSLYASKQPKPQDKTDSAPHLPAETPPSSSISVITPPISRQNAAQTRLIDKIQEELDNGLRRTSTFQQADGRTFTRVEEITLTSQGARRAVIQQNPSGAITRYEEVLDRQSSGSFRRTQRFQDEAGEVATQITPDYRVTDPFILTGGAAPSYTLSSFDSSRGTQLDLRA